METRIRRTSIAVIVPILGITLMIASCNLPGAASATETASPAAPTNTESPTAEPPATQQPTNTSTPLPTTTEDWRLMFYQLSLTYDPDHWQVVGDGLEALEHTGITECRITEQGPTEFPKPSPDFSTTLRGVRYDIFARVGQTEMERIDWYAAVDGFANPQPGTTPLLRVEAPEGEWGSCMAAAERVLGTLEASSPASTPGSTLDQPVPETYTIHVGEFPYCLARRFNIDPKELMAFNDLEPGVLVAVGTVLEIPQDASPFQGLRALRSHPATYRVQQGDTIYGIACYYGDVFPESIAALNDLEEPYTLSPGMILEIP